MIKSGVFLLLVCEIVPIFRLETIFVPIFTKGPSCIHNGNNGGFDRTHKDVRRSILDGSKL